MITIKTLWLYLAIIASLMTGVGAGYAILPPSADLERELRLAREQIDGLKRECAGENGREIFKRAPVKDSAPRGF